MRFLGGVFPARGGLRSGESNFITESPGVLLAVAFWRKTHFQVKDRTAGGRGDVWARVGKPGK